MDKLQIKDLNFIHEVSPELAGTVTMMIALSIDQIYEGLTRSEAEVDAFLADLDTSKCDQITTFYQSALEYMEGREMFEECARIIFILETIKLHKESLSA